MNNDYLTIKRFAEATIDNWVEPQSDVEPMTRPEAIEALCEDSHDLAECAAEWCVDEGSMRSHNDLCHLAGGILQNYS